MVFPNCQRLKKPEFSGKNCRQSFTHIFALTLTCGDNLNLFCFRNATATYTNMQGSYKETVSFSLGLYT